MKKLRIVICLLIAILLFPSKAYAAETTATVYPLDENRKDFQGVLYSLNSLTKQATVGDWYSSNTGNKSEYVGANNGVCRIPDIVSYDGVEYKVFFIEDRAFYSNGNIKELYISDSVRVIGGESISFSTIQKVHIGAGVSRINPDSFISNTYLQSIFVDSNNTAYADVDGVLFEKDKDGNLKSLICYPMNYELNASRTYTVPQGVQEIEARAFENVKLRKVVIPDSVKTINSIAFKNSWIEEIDISSVETTGMGIFTGCERLRSVQFPVNATSFPGTLENTSMEFFCYNRAMSGYASLKNCKYLNTLVIDEGTSQVASEAFSNCVGLKNIIIPDTVTILKSGSFADCTGLERIYIPESVDLISADVLKNTNAVIYGKAGSCAQSYAKENGFEFVDVSSHNHLSLTQKVVFENPYVQCKANYCDICGYGENVMIDYKDRDTYQDQLAIKRGYDLQSSRRIALLDNGWNQGLRYTFYSGDSLYWRNEANVSGINDGDSKATVVIAEVVDDGKQTYVVSGVNKNAFKESERIQTLVIPDTVDSISDNSFATNTLKRIYIGANVKKLNSKAFGDNTTISDIYVSPLNLHFYVKNHILYNEDGEIIYDFSGNYSDPQDEPSTQSTDALGETTDEKKDDEDKKTEKTTEVDNSSTEKDDVSNPVEKTTEVDNSSIEKNDESEDLSVVKDIILSSSNGKDIKLKWTKNEQYSKYEVYRSEKKSGDYQKIAVVESTAQYTDKKVSAYKKYYYKIRGVYEKSEISKEGPFSEPQSYMVTNQKAITLKIRKKRFSSGQKYLQINAKNASGAYIQLFVKKQGGKYQQIKLTNSQTKKNKGLLKVGYNTEKKLWIKVRTYNVHKGKKYYSDYSNEVCIKP